MKIKYFIPTSSKVPPDFILKMNSDFNFSRDLILRKKVWGLIALLFIVSGCSVSKISENIPPAPVDSSTTTPATSTSPGTSGNTPTPQPNSQTPSPPKKEDTSPTPALPLVVNLPVAFASQAPFGVWDELHGEACEEASMIMVAKYFKGASLSPHIMEQEILNLVTWETDQGYLVDVTTAEAAIILHDHFGLSATVATDVSTDRIKRELAAGNLIIVPAAGRELGNPYFQNPGPIYHMLVIRGYDETAGEFITNDPGTKRGEGYRYRYQTLLSAVHDWDHAHAEGGMTDKEMAQGRKVLIVVSK